MAFRRIVRFVVPDIHPVIATGARVLLREIGPEDAPAAMAWAADLNFFRYLPYEPIADQASEEEFLRGLETEAASRPRRQYHLGVVWHETDELIGMVRLGITSPENREGDLGYGVRLDKAGQGITTEAVALLLDLGFGPLRLHRIFAYHHPRNVASRRVLEKLGMEREGTLRENLFAHGAWRDSVLHAILEHEWAARLRDNDAD
jgi:RimJ/RimL family protein N-acetyltransferase